MIIYIYGKKIRTYLVGKKGTQNINKDETGNTQKFA